MWECGVLNLNYFTFKFDIKLQILQVGPEKVLNFFFGIVFGKTLNIIYKIFHYLPNGILLNFLSLAQDISL